MIFYGYIINKMLHFEQFLSPMLLHTPTQIIWNILMLNRELHKYRKQLVHYLQPIIYCSFNPIGTLAVRVFKIFDGTKSRYFTYIGQPTVISK